VFQDHWTEKWSFGENEDSTICMTCKRSVSFRKSKLCDILKLN